MVALIAMAVVGAPDWKLVWSDEFDRAGLPDPSKWTYEKGYVRNNEAQYYTEGRKENARVENGRLVIEARKDNFEGKPISSASLTTKGKGEWTYGRFEVRAKIPTGRGTWPAIWMLGTNIGEVGWPKCGEIDLMENVGYDPDRIHFNVHTEAYNHTKGTNKGANVTVAKPYENFHVYACEWYPDRIDFFMDGKKTFSFAKEEGGDAVWPYYRPQYLILNLAIGGGWGGQKGIDDKILPSRYEIDYVRVYKAQ